MKAAWYDVPCALKKKLDFVNVTNLFQNVNKLDDAKSGSGRI